MKKVTYPAIDKASGSLMFVEDNKAFSLSIGESALLEDRAAERMHAIFPFLTVEDVEAITPDPVPITVVSKPPSIKNADSVLGNQPAKSIDEDSVVTPVEDMPWQEIRKLAKELGVYDATMNKQELIAAINMKRNN